MHTVVRLELAPTREALLTPSELLEDFADSTSGWQYLDETTSNYTDERGVPASVIRYWGLNALPCVDLVFSSLPSTTDDRLCLRIVQPTSLEETLPLSRRNDVIEAFLQHFGAYLDERREGHVRLETERDEVAPSREAVAA